MSQGHGAGGIIPTRPESSVWPAMRCERLTSTVVLNVGGATPRNLVSTTDWASRARPISVNLRGTQNGTQRPSGAHLERRCERVRQVGRLDRHNGRAKVELNGEIACGAQLGRWRGRRRHRRRQPALAKGSAHLTRPTKLRMQSRAISDEADETQNAIKSHQ